MKRNTLQSLAFLSLVGLVAGIGIFVVRRGESGPPERKASKPLAPVAVRKRENEAIVTKNRSNPDPKVQDKVGAAELQLAFFDAQAHDFASSRKTFQEAAKIKGTGAMSMDFGGIRDQAAYQAIVCLVPQHKEEQAKTEFRQFMRDWQLSPLVHAAYKRLIRLNGGKSDPKDEQLLQAAVAAQEKHIHFETSVCGPKTVAYLLDQGLIKPTVADKSDYKSLAKLFGTTDSGTTMDQLRSGLKKLGIESYGLKVNRRDFNVLPTPAIMLTDDHYLAVLKISQRKMEVYDSRYGSTREVPLPDLDTPEFSATVLTFQPIVPLEATN